MSLWRFSLVTENNSASVFVEEPVARQLIDDWLRYEQELADEIADAEEIGRVYTDRKGSLVRKIEGWYAPDVEPPEPPKEGETVPEPKPVAEDELKRAIIAYRLCDIQGMSANELP